MYCSPTILYCKFRKKYLKKKSKDGILNTAVRKLNFDGEMAELAEGARLEIVFALIA